MEQLIPLLVQVLGGAAGGNVVAALLKDKNLSKIVATIAGMIGGVAGGQLATVAGILEKLAASGGADLGSILGNAASSGVGGALLTALVAFIQKSMAPKA